MSGDGEDPKAVDSVTTRVRQAVVLAGGRGTRLGALTEEVPKPLLNVGGRPFIEWVIANLGRQGVDDIVLTVGYRAEAFHDWVDGLVVEGDVRLFVEDEPLDTGGALCAMAQELADAFFVLNGDTLFDVSLPALSDCLFDARNPEASVALSLRPVPDASRYGAVQHSGGRVSTFAEKSTSASPGWVNGGVYAMRRSALERYEGRLSIERTLIPELVAERRVTALPCDGFFIDIGVPETYDEAQASVPAWWAGVGE